MPQTGVGSVKPAVAATCSAVVGLQWGDEGKGKAVDLLAPQHDAVARYNGGANAGHSVVVNGQLIPAGHTDLVLASIGEEVGFLGVAFILILYGLLVMRFLRISLNARRDASFFLGLGLTLLLAIQIALIVSGVLGLFPLTGVVNPFLSWGKSSMIANFVILGLLVAISSDSSKDSSLINFKIPVRAIAVVFSVLVLGFIMSIFGLAKRY